MPDVIERVPPEALLAAYPEPMRRIGEDLRALVRRAMPEAVERVRTGWRIIGYDVEGRIPRARWVTFRPGDPIAAPRLDWLVREAACVARLSPRERLAATLDREISGRAPG